MKFLVLFLMMPMMAFAGRLQNSDFATLTELQSRGASATSLLNDTKIYITANGLNKQLSTAIADGTIGGSGQASYAPCTVTTSATTTACTFYTVSGTLTINSAVTSLTVTNSGSTTQLIASGVTFSAPFTEQVSSTSATLYTSRESFEVKISSGTAYFISHKTPDRTTSGTWTFNVGPTVEPTTTKSFSWYRKGKYFFANYHYYYSSNAGCNSNSGVRYSFNMPMLSSQGLAVDTTVVGSGFLDSFTTRTSSINFSKGLCGHGIWNSTAGGGGAQCILNTSSPPTIGIILPTEFSTGGQAWSSSFHGCADTALSWDLNSIMLPIQQWSTEW